MDSLTMIFNHNWSKVFV